MGVVTELGGSNPVGTAFAVGYTPGPRGSVSTFRLVIGKAPAKGLYVVDRRRFVSLEEWGRGRGE